MLASILSTPLHPAVVHLPIALTLLVLPVAAGALCAIHRGARPVRAWGLATAFFAALTFSAWAAVQTGEQTVEQVERVVAEGPIDSHEEAAEAFLTLSVGVLAVSLLGLGRGRIGQGARALAVVGALSLLVAGWNVGHSGGKLVYQYGAASAYAIPPATVARAGAAVDSVTAPAMNAGNQDLNGENRQ